MPGGRGLVKHRGATIRRVGTRALGEELPNGIRIPVVTRTGSLEELGWPFNESALKAFLTEATP